MTEVKHLLLLDTHSPDLTLKSIREVSTPEVMTLMGISSDHFI